MTAQHLRPDAMEGAEPRHALHGIADDPPDPLLHFPRGFVGEGHSQNFRRPSAPRRDDMRQPRGQCRCLPGACACEHQHRAFGRQHCFLLRRVQALDIGWVNGLGGNVHGCFSIMDIVGGRGGPSKREECCHRIRTPICSSDGRPFRAFLRLGQVEL